MKRILARLLLAALALTACSSAPVKSTTPTVAGGGQTTTTASPNPTASSTAKAQAGTGGLHIVGTPTPNCYAMELTYEPQNPVANYVSVTVDVARGFSSNCPELAVGRDCFIPLAGTWRLMSTPPGSLRVQLYEDDDKTPTRSFTFGGLGPHGQLTRTAGFRYTPSKGTKIARFNVGLLDSNGTEVARTLNQFLPLPTCDPRRRS
jgi:hypothetical protein